MNADEVKTHSGDTGHEPPKAKGGQLAIKLLRSCAAFVWLTWAISVGLLWGQHRAGVLHPAALLFVVLLTLTLLTALAGTAYGLWRIRRNPARRAVGSWTLACFLPLIFWMSLADYTLRLSASGQSFPQNAFSDIARVGVASLMECGAEWTYPHRLESERLVMFYDDRVTNPQQDLEAMDRHVAHLEEVTGKPLRAKIHWVRGEVFGRRQMAIGGLVLGSSKSPANWDTADHADRLSVDRHELAHGVIHQLQPPDTDAPTLLIEGWAEAHAGMTSRTRAEFALQSRRVWCDQSGAGPKQSYLRHLTGPDGYRRLDGPVYSVGGAFAEYILEKFGAERFLKLYFTCRPGLFEEKCVAQFGVEFDALESAFWTEVERLAETNVALNSSAR